MNYTPGDYYRDCAKEADRIRDLIAKTTDPKKLKKLKAELEMALYTGD
jgi:hypothetical protein